MTPPRYQSHVLGTGPVVIELWLDYICPFSKKQFEGIWNNDLLKLSPKVSWVFNNYPQPWHSQGGWLHEAGIAVGLIAPTLFWEFSAALFREQRLFFDEAILDLSRTQILERVADIAASVGVDREALLAALRIDGDSSDPQNKGSAVIADVKYFVRLGRQTGIHVTPTVVLAGTVDASISSSFTEHDWHQKIDSASENFCTTRL